MQEAFLLVFRLEFLGANVCKSCRSRQELSNEYLLTNFGVDTAENGPLNVRQKIAKSKKWEKGKSPKKGKRS